MYSMTGYGRGSAQLDGREMTVELKSVNHRFLDVSMRLPRHLSFLEDVIRQDLQASLSRGHVDVFVNYRNTRSDARTVVVDEELLGAYLSAARQAGAHFGLTDDISLDAAMRLPNVTEFREADEDTEAVTELCHQAVKLALDGLIAMRLREGNRLMADFEQKLQNIETLTAKIAQRAPLVIVEYREKLNERIAQLIDTGEVDRARLATEVALFADKAAIDEELVRLSSHVAGIRSLFQENGPCGRKLDFLVQELNREFNTIGSKANDGTLTGHVLDGKNEIEKLREQVQNIE